MIVELTSAIPDAYTGEDGVIRIIYDIESGQFENLYLAMQLLLEDMFVSTASYQALTRHGEQYGLPMKPGVQSTGQLRFDGDGGTYIPIGTEAAYDPGGGLDPVFFQTTEDATIPNPGDPDAPTAVASATNGNLDGGYEYVVTIVTANGETLPSDRSATVNPIGKQVNLSNIAIGGGPNIIARKLYRLKNGSGDFRLVTTINDNTTTTFIDNVTDAAVAAGSVAPTVDTAHRVVVDAQAAEVGVEGNVMIGTVTELTNAPATLTGVYNPVAFTGGDDQEDSDDYRQRLLTFIQNPQTGSCADLEAWAEGVPGVETATSFENTPVNGTVTVRITGPNGSIPSASVISDVQAQLDALDYANITIIVATFNPVSTNVTVDVTVASGFDIGIVTPTVQEAVSNYINSLGAGETLKIAGIIDAVFGLSGITDVVVTSPTANQTTNPADKRVPGTISVT